MKYNALPMGDGFDPLALIRRGTVWKFVKTLDGNVILSFVKEIQNNSTKALDILISKFTPEVAETFLMADDDFDMERNILLAALDAKSRTPRKIEILNFESVAPGFFERLMRGEDAILIKGEDKK